MEKRQYNFLIRLALLLTIAWIVWSIYDGAIREKTIGENYYHAGNKFFEDGLYDDALDAYQQALDKNPYLIHARRGIARTLMQLNRYEEALSVFNNVITQEPDFAASYANRGILHDRLQSYTAAIADYEKAIQLDPELAKGPSWLTRFLRNQAEKPPTILDRMNYLKAEQKKPEGERILQIPEKDREQRPYKR